MVYVAEMKHMGLISIQQIINNPQVIRNTGIYDSVAC